VQFRMFSCEAYNILRKSADLILSLFHLMAGASIEAIRNNPENAMLKLQVRWWPVLCGVISPCGRSRCCDVQLERVMLCSQRYAMKARGARWKLGQGYVSIEEQRRRQAHRVWSAMLKPQVCLTAVLQHGQVECVGCSR
jgi:hypothetical protein